MQAGKSCFALGTQQGEHSRRFLNFETSNAWPFARVASHWEPAGKFNFLHASHEIARRSNREAGQ